MILVNVQVNFRILVYVAEVHKEKEFVSYLKDKLCKLSMYNIQRYQP